MHLVSAGSFGVRVARRWWALATLAAVACLVPALTLPSGQLPRAAATAGTEAMPLQQFVSDGANGRLWNAYNATTSALGPTISGRPAPFVYGGTEQALALSATGDLVQYAHDGLNSRPWNAYDLTTASSGPTIVGDPSVVTIDSTAIYAFARTSSGDLVEFTNDNVGGRLWNASDLTQETGTAIQNDASPVLVGNTIEVFADAANGHLVMFSGTGSDLRSWTTLDLTQASGGPTLSGSPNAVLYGSSTHVYGSSSGGHLFEFDNDGQQGRTWNAYDLTVDSAGPVVSGQPSPIVYGWTVHVDANANGHLVEFDNDDAGGRLWNSYDLTAITHGPTITGSPSAVRFVGPYVEVFAQSPGGDLENYINDDAGGRLWNPYDLTSASAGPALGADPAALVNGSSIAIFAAGPPPPAVLQAIVSNVETQDQHHLAVVENPAGSNCNIYTGYWGRGTTTGCVPANASEEWCSDFAQWAWASAGIDTSGINGWAFTFVGWGEERTGAWKPGTDNNPEPGDAVVWGDMSSSYAQHVGIVVGVSGGLIDVVSGNSGPPIDAAGDVDAVWDSGYFDPTTSTIDGYPIIGYVSPTGWTGFVSNAHAARVPAGSTLEQEIARQDGGR